MSREAVSIGVKSERLPLIILIQFAALRAQSMPHGPRPGLVPTVWCRRWFPAYPAAEITGKDPKPEDDEMPTSELCRFGTWYMVICLFLTLGGYFHNMQNKQSVSLNPLPPAARPGWCSGNEAPPTRARAPEGGGMASTVLVR